MVGVGFGAAAAPSSVRISVPARYNGCRRSGWITTGFASVVGVVAAVVEIIFAEQFAHSSPMTGRHRRECELSSYLRAVAAFVGAELVLEGALGGAGHTLPPMLTSTALTALRIPLAAWAAFRWGIEGIWWVICLTATARGYRHDGALELGRWKRKSL